MVTRPRLCRALDAIPAGGVGVLVAPAGSGKSVLMAQWIAQHPTAWLGVHEGHDDAVALARALATVLHGARESFDPAVAQLVQTGGTRLGPVFVDALAEELGDLAAPVVLVLDDLHRISNADSLSDLGDLLVRLPDTVRVLVSSRWDQPLHVGRLRLEGRLVEIRWSDLAFEPDEAVELLERVSGRAISRPQTSALVERTDGWAAGLQLAALSLQKAPDVDAFVAGFAGDDRLVADYLTGEVLRSLDPDVRVFLLRTSVLEWLTPELCDAVTGQEGGGRIMRSLAESGVFVSPVEGSPGRLRFHHLFADLLRFQLRVEEPDAEVGCRRRAARWLLAHGEHRAGVEQLLDSGEYEQAFEIVDIEGHRLFEHGETATLARALGKIRDNIAEPSARVRISLLASQVGADQYGAAGETYRELTKLDLAPGERIAADALATILGFGDLALAEVKRLASGVFEGLSRIDRGEVVDFLGAGGADSCETVAAIMYGLAEVLEADLAAGAATLTKALDLPGATYPAWRINALGMLAFTHVCAGRLTEAERCALAALECARDTGALDHLSVTLAHLSLGTVGLERLDHAEMGVHLDAAARIVARCHRPAYHQLLQLLQARQLMVTSGPGRALDHLRGPTPAGPRRELVVRSRTSLEAKLLVRSGSLREARTVLEAASTPAPAAWFDLHVAEGDVQGARKILETWRPVPAEPRPTLERDLRTAVLKHAEGHTGAAGTAVADAATQAEAEGFLVPFLETPVALNILRNSAPSRPLRRVAGLLKTTPADDGRGRVNDGLVEPLTARELAVLDFLPSRLSNGEIADALFVSVNTLKTHLRNIYRKLGVADRNELVRHASAIGLM